MDIMDKLGKRIGPLPLGVWIAVVVGGLGIGWYFSRGMSEENGKETQLTESGVGVGGGQFVYEPIEEINRPDQEPDTNEKWGNRAINWLITQGVDGTVATSAITKFLTGANRTWQEALLINRVLLKFGTPPESVPLPDVPDPQIPKPPPAKPPPKPPKPPAKPGGYKYYTTVRGDTLAVVSKKTGVHSWVIYWANDRANLRPDGSPGVLRSPLSIPANVRLVVPTGKTTPVPTVKPGAYRYHTVKRGETLTTISNLYKTHVFNIFTANDVVGPRPDGSKGFLTTMTISPGQRLIIPYD